MTQALVVLCTCPDEASALALAKTLLEARLAACVNLIPKVRSLYLWQGQLCDDTEVQLVIKSSLPHFEALAERVRALHPYDIPEILALPVSAGDSRYLTWLEEVVSP